MKIQKKKDEENDKENQFNFEDLSAVESDFLAFIEKNKPSKAENEAENDNNNDNEVNDNK